MRIHPSIVAESRREKNWTAADTSSYEEGILRNPKALLLSVTPSEERRCLDLR